VPFQAIHAEFFDTLAEQGRGFGSSGVDTSQRDEPAAVFGGSLCTVIIDAQDTFIVYTEVHIIDYADGGDIYAVLVHPPDEFVAFGVIYQVTVGRQNFLQGPLDTGPFGIEKKSGYYIPGNDVIGGQAHVVIMNVYNQFPPPFLENRLVRYLAPETEFTGVHYLCQYDSGQE